MSNLNMRRREFLGAVGSYPVLDRLSSVDRAPSDGNWRMFGRDLRNSSYVEGGGPVKRAETVWEYETGSSVLSSPSVVDGTVYVGSWDGTVYALNVDEGQVVWEFETEDDVPETYSAYSGRVGSSPCVAEDRVLFGSWDGNIYAVDRKRGEEVWRFGTPSIVRSSPVEKDGTVYIGDWTGSMNAVRLEDGEEVWSYETGRDHIYSTPCVDNGTLYFGGMDANREGDGEHGDLHAVDGETGDRVWRFEAGNAVGSSPTFHDGAVYFGSFDGNVYSVEAETGEERWRHETDDSIASSPAVDGERVYIGSWDNRLYALDIETGEKQWSYETGDRLYASNVTMTDDAVYFGSHDGRMRAVRPDDGSLLWEYETDDWVRSGAAVVDGRVYFGSWDGTVYALYNSQTRSMNSKRSSGNEGTELFRESSERLQGKVGPIRQVAQMINYLF
jgi:outer membrane protein assembly factor BamB